MSVQYRKIKIDHSEGAKQNEMLIAFLSEEGYDSFEERNDGLDAYIEDRLFQENVLFDTIEKLFWTHRPELSSDLLEDKNWNAEWEDSYPAVEFSEAGIRVRAPFHLPDPNFRDEIIIEPGMAFGTGHHETTGQILEVLSSMDLNDLSVADAGCGSGVLAIYAAKKGASHVFAFDNDEWASRNAKLNFEHNGLDPAQAHMTDASSLEGRSFDVFIANINRNIILNDLHVYAPAVKSGGTMILSGFLESDVEMLMNKCSEFGLSKKDMRSRNNWVVLILSKI